MKKKNISLMVLAIAIFISIVVVYFLSIGKSGITRNTESSSAKRSELFIYTWADYIKPELVERFEKENNCKVIIDTFDSNEAMYSKFKAGATGYDVITPSSYMVSLLSKQGMIIELDHAKIPNISNVDPDYLKLSLDPDMKHSVPYMFSVTGVGYLKSKVSILKPSWSIFERKEFKGRMTMLNDMRETIGAALKYLGKSINSTDEKDLEAAKNVVIGWKRNLAKFENEQYKTGLASEEFYVVHGYGGDLMQVQTENPDIQFFIPEEGTVVCFDDLVIPKWAKNVELAHKFINFLHDPQIAAENTEFIKYLCPNKTSYSKLSPEIRNNEAIFLKPEVRIKCEAINDLGENNLKYTKIWDQIKAAQ